MCLVCNEVWLVRKDQSWQTVGVDKLEEEGGGRGSVVREGGEEETEKREGEEGGKE